MAKGLQTTQGADETLAANQINNDVWHDLCDKPPG